MPQATYSTPMALSPGRGLTFATLALAAPYGVPLALSTSVADATTGSRRAAGANEARLLLSWHHCLDLGSEQEELEWRKLAIKTTDYRKLRFFQRFFPAAENN
jgi:hypothetical protein